ncbi:sugar ABC transporter [Synechococcus sp. HB1133]|uniref:sugar ABC transporter n=1 Tax=unclassified Synechococcus TaxID=2626047 RepID=UPI001408A695|nr:MULTISPECIES: sugar ABC transporter [unclassified Synechococcus]MCB4394215.1 sugar ABC transporter [Synechococcus sp. PH41509]MCB4423424.1 sugar ABC transporter [Synechococcus sp. HB1133]MCB4431465.1 sugar ABC transporter [Synechococcus sp. HBA1120]NHI82372.1 sugar ABC transporter [Synechococcus sp. HB1133]
MPESLPPSSSSSSLQKEIPSSFRISNSLVQDQPTPLWREQLDRIAKPRVLISVFLATSAFYCFVIGRDRYTAVSEFVIQQALPLEGASASVLSGAAAAPQVLTSLVDGQYLQVYLESSDVKTRLFPDGKKLEQDYRIKLPDLRAGLPANSSAPAQLGFYRKQLSVAPQPLSGSVILTTSGFSPEQAFNLNNELLKQSRRFVNEVNQSINADQNLFARKEVQLAQTNLKAVKRNLELFQEKHGNLSVLTEQAAASSYISGLESQLVDLKVQEAALRRQYRDPNAPEVSFIADQVKELEVQIREERDSAISKNGRDLNTLALEEAGLISDVEFATQTLQSARLASDNSRRESQRQLKFVVVLSQPQLPVKPDHNWRWQAFLGSVGIIIVAWGVGGFLLNAMRKS